MGGLGLVSMEERARQVGGKFEIQSVHGGGTQIMVAIPWNEGMDGELAAGSHT
jgi:signal transduction histidine kinase